jgi:phage/plasmid-like protein (TIGR03299 family)
MSKETLATLNTQALIGYTSKRGHAWHYRAEEQGAESNHYEGAIPVEDVARRLFNWKALEGTITATAITPEGTITTIDETHKAIMRSDTGALLGVFKRGYQIHDYQEWLVDNVGALLDTSELAIGSAGLLSGGAVAWVMVEMEDTIETPEGVKARPFMTSATSLDGSLASTYQLGAQVTVCDNTLSVALSERTERIKIKHSSKSLGRLSDAREALNIVHGIGETFAAQVAELSRVSVSDREWARFVDAYTGDPGESKNGQTIKVRRSDELHQLYRHDERVSPWAGTAWGVVQAVNTHVHHVATVRNASRAERNMERMVTGKIDALDQGTLALLATVQG